MSNIRIFDGEKMVDISAKRSNIKETIGAKDTDYYACLKAFYIGSVDDAIMKLENLNIRNMSVRYRNSTEEVNNAIDMWFDKHPDDAVFIDGDSFFDRKKKKWRQKGHYNEYGCMMTIAQEGMQFDWVQ